MKTMTLALLLAIVLSACAPAVTPTPTPVPPTATPIPPPTPTPFSGSARVKLDDITMYFEVQGEGKPLILLHGALGSGMCQGVLDTGGKNLVSFDKHSPDMGTVFEALIPTWSGQRGGMGCP